MEHKNNLEYWGSVHDGMFENEGYRKQMDPDKGPREVTERVANLLKPHSSIFEYGVGSGANAIFLAKEGHSIEAQDVSEKFIEGCQSFAEQQGVRFSITHSLAQEHALSSDYDAFVCTFVLHFMPKEEATKVIENMKSHTLSGGYNALSLFTYNQGPLRADRYYPTPEEFLSLYPGWEVCHRKAWTSNTSDGASMDTLSLILRKPA